MKSKREGFQKRSVITVSVVHFVHDIYTSFLAPALPLIIDKLGMSYGLAGLLAVIQRISSFFNPLVGIIAERPVMKYMVILSPAITAASMSLIGVAPGYIFLAIVLFVSGFSSTMWHVPTPTMIKHLSGDRTGKGMSYYMMGGELARTAGPLIILGVIELWGLEGTWKMMPLGFAASIILYLNFRKFNPRPVEHIASEGSYWKIFVKFLPAFALTGGFTFCIGGIKAALTYYLPTYLTDAQDHSLHFADISLTVLQLAGAAGAYFAGTLSDKMGRTNMLLIIGIVLPLLMFLFLNLEDPHWIIPVLVPLGFFLFAPISVMLAVVQDLDTNKKTFVNSIYMFINFFISSLIIPMVGVLTDKYGFETSYMIFNMMSIGAGFIVLFTRKRIQLITGK